ncbi:PTS transporter subunit EIIC [Lachnospiraceae bacterium 54-53]
MNNIAQYGRDTLFTITGPNNFAQAGATLGVFLKSKNKKVRDIAGPAALSATLAGITEPAIYGVTLKYKKPFFIGAFFSGIAGAITAAAGAGAPALIGTSRIRRGRKQKGRNHCRACQRKNNSIVGGKG